MDNLEVLVAKYDDLKDQKESLEHKLEEAEFYFDNNGIYAESKLSKVREDIAAVEKEMKTISEKLQFTTAVINQPYRY